MPAKSSTYYNPADFDSDDDPRNTYTKKTRAREYIDPWDLENYAYIRKQLVETPTASESYRSRLDQGNASPLDEPADSTFYYVSYPDENLVDNYGYYGNGTYGYANGYMDPTMYPAKCAGVDEEDFYNDRIMHSAADQRSYLASLSRQERASLYNPKRLPYRPFEYDPDYSEFTEASTDFDDGHNTTDSSVFRYRYGPRKTAPRRRSMAFPEKPFKPVIRRHSVAPASLAGKGYFDGIRNGSQTSDYASKSSSSNSEETFYTAHYPVPQKSSKMSTYKHPIYDTTPFGPTITKKNKANSTSQLYQQCSFKNERGTLKNSQPFESGDLNSGRYVKNSQRYGSAQLLNLQHNLKNSRKYGSSDVINLVNRETVSTKPVLRRYRSSDIPTAYDLELIEPIDRVNEKPKSETKSSFKKLKNVFKSTSPTNLAGSKPFVDLGYDSRTYKVSTGLPLSNYNLEPLAPIVPVVPLATVEPSPYVDEGLIEDFLPYEVDYPRNQPIPIYSEASLRRRKPKNFGLNNYGHLEIDYSFSWSTLDRFIGK